VIRVVDMAPNMRDSPISLLAGGHICARLGSPLASAVQQEKIARTVLAKASPIFVVREDEGCNERRRTEYSEGASIPRAVLCGREPRAIFAFYTTVDWEWFARVARRLYLPAVVRNPRTMFSRSLSAFETTRRRVTADHLDLVIALGETNPLEFALFMASPKSAREVYRILSAEAKVPKKWSRFGGLTV